MPARRNPTADTIAATVVSIVLCFIVAAILNVIWVLMERIRGLDINWLQALGRLIVCPIVGTYAGIRAGKLWFPEARVRATYYAFAAINLGLFAIPIAVLALNSAPLGSSKSLYEGSAFISLTIVSGWIFSRRLEAEAKAQQEREAYWDARRIAAWDNAAKATEVDPNKATTTLEAKNLEKDH